MDDLIGRLENWKFESALAFAKDCPVSPLQLGVIEALAKSYGNCGWFEGNAAVLVGAVVENLVDALEEKKCARDN